MTSQSPRIYTYKITFEEVPYYYYGVHKEKVFGEEYWGSPYTNKWCWELYTTKKQILQLFDFTDEGWLEAQEVEKRLIKPFYNEDKWCLNENCGGRFSIKHQKEAGRKGGLIVGKMVGQRVKDLGIGICGLTYEERVKYGKLGLETQRKNNLGVFGLTDEQRSENGKKGAQKTKELGVGLYSQTLEEKIEAGKLGGKASYEMKTGVHGRTKEQMTEDGKKSAQIRKKNNVGIFAMTFEQRSKNAKNNYENGIGLASITKEERQEIVAKTNSQKWMCLETGYITTSGPLTTYQRAKGIDTSKRKRIE